MITPEKLTKKKLCKILVRKNKKFLGEYQREFELLNKIKVMKEKQDLLEYWLNSSQSSKKENGYLKELEKVDKELEKLKDEYAFFSENDGFDDNYLKNRHKFLKEKIKAKEKAIPYWRGKSKEDG